MNTLVKILIPLVVAACVISDVYSFKKQTGVLKNLDCGCTGYVAKATECLWPQQTCDQTSESFKNFVFWCSKVNSFRDSKRNGTTESTYTRALTCKANLNLQDRQAIQCGTKMPGMPKSQLAQNGIPPLIPFTDPVPTVTSDWTDKFLPVKDQMNCGSCWAFGS